MNKGILLALADRQIHATALRTYRNATECTNVDGHVEIHIVSFNNGRLQEWMKLLGAADIDNRLDNAGTHGPQNQDGNGECYLVEGFSQEIRDSRESDQYDSRQVQSKGSNDDGFVISQNDIGKNGTNEGCRISDGS